MLLVGIVVFTLLLAAFTYQIVTTPVTPVDAPTLAKSAPAAPAPAAGLPARQQPSPVLPGRSGQPRTASGAAAPRSRPAAVASRAGAADGARSWGVAAMAIVGLAAGIIGGWLFLRTASGAIACTQQAFQVCSQGFVLLTGTQLMGGVIAVAGVVFAVIAGVFALR